MVPFIFTLFWGEKVWVLHFNVSKHTWFSNSHVFVLYAPHHPNLLFHSSISRYHPVPQTFLLFIPTTPSSKGYSGYSFLIILRKNFSIWMLCSMDHVDAWDAGEKRWCMCLIRKRKKKHKRKRPKNSLREIKLHNHSTIIVLINHILNNIMLFFISPNPYLLIYCYSW